MKITFAIVALLLSAQAQALEIRVTSFRMIPNQRELSEICGRIVGNVEPQTAASPADMNGLVPIEIVADYQTSAPAYYNTWSKVGGAFCQIISAYTGRAELRIVGHKAEAKAQ